MKMKALNIAL
ncbi:hypothetical protein D018_3169A, partial [Vibrio parahaemolyticus VP2007-007]